MFRSIGLTRCSTFLIASCDAEPARGRSPWNSDAATKQAHEIISSFLAQGCYRCLAQFCEKFSRVSHIGWLIGFAALRYRGEPRRIGFDQQPVRWHFGCHITDVCGILKRHDARYGYLKPLIQRLLGHRPRLRKAVKYTFDPRMCSQQVQGIFLRLSGMHDHRHVVANPEVEL